MQFSLKKNSKISTYFQEPKVPGACFDNDDQFSGSFNYPPSTDYTVAGFIHTTPAACQNSIGANTRSG